jgi:hypothetical protein
VLRSSGFRSCEAHFSVKEKDEASLARHARETLNALPSFSLSGDEGVLFCGLRCRSDSFSPVLVSQLNRPREPHVRAAKSDQYYEENLFAGARGCGRSFR